jgi:hypothetical protein
MTAYATSEFGLHSLLTVLDIVSGAMTAACYIPLAKALDIWGRAESFMLWLACLLWGWSYKPQLRICQHYAQEGLVGAGSL